MDRSKLQKLHLTAADDGLELSREEFAEADFQEPWKYERVNGRLVVIMPPNFDHQDLMAYFHERLVLFKVAHPEIVARVFPDSWTTIDEDTDRLPDLGVYFQSNPDWRNYPDAVPDLVFEVVSQTARDRRRDYEEKRAEFERIGVPEYVIVDRFDHRVLVLRLEDGTYAETLLGPDDVYTSPALPGLEIPLTGVI